MKIKKYNELTDYSSYKEYDEYSHIDINIINEWYNNFSQINNFISDFTHEIKMYSQFINEYVVCNNRDTIIIPSDIKLIYDDKKFKIYFYDTHTNISIVHSNIKYIKHIKEISEIDQNLFLKLYDRYIKEFKAPYMTIFGKDEFKHILNTTKYNL